LLAAANCSRRPLELLGNFINRSFHQFLANKLNLILRPGTMADAVFQTVLDYKSPALLF